MSEIGEGGRMVTFVSHSMPAILRLCDRAILLDHGRVIVDGPTYEAVGGTWSRVRVERARAYGMTPQACLAMP